MIRAVFFDAVGTLLSPAEPVGETYARFAEREGLEAAPAALERCFREAFRASPPLAFPGAPRSDLPVLEQDWWRAVVAGAFRRAGIQAAAPALERVFRGVFDHFAERAAWQPFPDTRPALAGLRERGLGLAVVSNFDSRLHGLLDEFRLSDSFDTVVISSESGFAKPATRIFTLALRVIGVHAAAALHVGDSQQLDVRPAKRAGLHALRIDRRAPSSATSIRSLLEIADRVKALTS